MAHGGAFISTNHPDTTHFKEFASVWAASPFPSVAESKKLLKFLLERGWLQPQNWTDAFGELEKAGSLKHTHCQHFLNSTLLPVAIFKWYCKDYKGLLFMVWWFSAVMEKCLDAASAAINDTYYSSQ